MRRPVRRDVERDPDRDPALGPVDVDPLVGLGPNRAGERRLAGLELEEAAGQDVDAARRVADDGALDPDRLAAEQHPRQVHAVAAHVVQRAAAELADVADVRRVVVVEPEPALDRRQPPDPARGDELADGDPRRMVAVHERLHQQDPGLVGRGDHPLRVGDRQRQRLLAQDVLARAGGGDRPLGVKVVGERDVDGVDVLVGEQCLVRAVDARDGQRRRDPRRGLGIARRDRDDLRVGRPAHARDDLLGRDVRGRQDAPPERRHRPSSSPSGRAAPPPRDGRLTPQRPM
jgi:hypothetical protein